MQRIYEINELARRCGYFYNAVLFEEGMTYNNGYNCRHPEQKEKQILKTVIQLAPVMHGRVHWDTKQMKRILFHRKLIVVGKPNGKKIRLLLWRKNR